MGVTDECLAQDKNTRACLHELSQHTLVGSPFHTTLCTVFSSFQEPPLLAEQGVQV